MSKFNRKHNEYIRIIMKGRSAMNWDDPAQRARHIEHVGADEYNRQLREHRRKSVVATINGHDIYPVGTRFGRLFVVGGTDKAFPQLEQAKAYAERS